MITVTPRCQPLASCFACGLALALFPDPVAAQGEGMWTSLPAVGALSPRYGQVAVWTGTVMLVWVGYGCLDGDTANCGEGQALGDGAAYDPAEGTWRPISPAGAPSPRADPSAVWTGREMLVWGGFGEGYLGDGAAYNPTTDTWRRLPGAGAPRPRYRSVAAWTGQALLICGGVNAALGGLLTDAASYDPKTNRWSALPPIGARAGRGGSVAVWTGTELLSWGCCHAGAGIGYVPATGAWLSVPADGSRFPQSPSVAVWTGREALIWGASGATRLNEPLVGQGAAFGPATDRWQAISRTGAPSPRFQPEGVWTGAELLIRGGYGDGDSLPRDGAAYDPQTDRWRPWPIDGAPAGRCDGSLVWTGRAMLVWGGNGICDGVGQQPRGDGAAYTPPAPTCRFVLGFNALDAAIPGTVGNCLDDEQHAINGDGLQHTIKGLLVWHKSDNVTAFTDGCHTWINGPHSIQERLNAQRFPWEADPRGLPVLSGEQS